MEKQEQQQKARAYWIRTYEQLGSISKAAHHCGIARSTLHRWLKRLPQEGLADRSRKPHKLARQKIDGEIINLILDIRDVYRFGRDCKVNCVKLKKREIRTNFNFAPVYGKRPGI